MTVRMSATEWDDDGDGTPDNYFLVTNALNLGQQLSTAFDEIIGTGRAPRRLPRSTAARSSSDTARLPGEVQQRRLDWSVAGLPGADRRERISARCWTVPIGKRRRNCRCPAPARSSRRIRMAATPVARRIRLGRESAPIARRRLSSSAPTDTRASCASTTCAATHRTRSRAAANSASARASWATSCRLRRFSSASLTSCIPTAWRPSRIPPSLRQIGSRQTMVYAGANDGMLHAFDATTGVEALAFIPSRRVREPVELTKPGYSHRFFVDGTPTVGDAFYGGALAHGARRRPQQRRPQHLRARCDRSERTSAKARPGRSTGGNTPMPTSATPIAGRPSCAWPMACGRRCSAAVTTPSGTGAAPSHRPRVSLHRRHRDRRVWITEPARSTPNGGSDRPRPNGLATPAVVDLNGDSIVDYAYAGDLLGNMWKFDLTSTTSVELGCLVRQRWRQVSVVRGERLLG